MASQSDISLHMCHGQRARLHKIGKEETPWYHCRQGQEQEREQSGRYIVEECPELTALRREVEKDEKDEIVESVVLYCIVFAARAEP